MSTGLFSPFELCFVQFCFFPLTNRPPSFLLLINRLSHSSPYNSFIPSLSTCTIQTCLPNLLNLQKHPQNLYFYRSDMIYTFYIFFEIQFTVLRLSVKYDVGWVAKEKQRHIKPRCRFRSGHWLDLRNTMHGAKRCCP